MTKPRKSRFQLNPTSSITFDLPYVVLVEGVDDQAIVSKLIEMMNLSNFHVVDVNGKSGWSRKVGLIAKDPNFVSNVMAFGVVRDADENPAAALNSCKTAFMRAGLPTPGRPLEVATGRPSTAILIAPSANTAGAIEELCLASFDQQRADCVDSYFECITQKGFPVSPTSKGKVQVYLGGLQPPARDIVVATERGQIDLANSCFDDIRLFLTNLSGVSP
jgi:hypothetical protein